MLAPHSNRTMLAAGMSLAIYILLMRRISGTAPAMVTTFYTSLLGGIMSAVVGLVWKDLLPGQWALLGLLALIVNTGHYLIVKAYENAEASLLAPLAFTEMIMAVAAGWYFLATSRTPGPSLASAYSSPRPSMSRCAKGHAISSPFAISSSLGNQRCRPCTQTSALPLNVGIEA